ncbi:Protein TIC 40, chloroplastic, partial [Linum perenne]
QPVHFQDFFLSPLHLNLHGKCKRLRLQPLRKKSSPQAQLLFSFYLFSRIIQYIMHHLNMALLSSPSSCSPKLVIGYPPTSLQNPTPRRTLPFFHLRNCRIIPRRSRVSASADTPPPQSQLAARSATSRRGKSGAGHFASILSSKGQNTSSVGVNPQPVSAPPPSQVGSPLFWIGVGVAFSALFSWKYAMQQAMKTMMSQMNTQNSQFGGNTPVSPFQFPTPSTSGPGTSPSWPAGSPSYSKSAATNAATSPAPAVSGSRMTVDVSAEEQASPTNVNNEVDTKENKNKYAFVDVSPEVKETLAGTPFGSADDANDASSVKDATFEASQNGAAFKLDATAAADEGSQSTRSGPALSVEALEKMMEDPAVQQMVFPYLPEEMRNPATFKWMLQNPEYRQQLQDMLNNMGGNNGWDPSMLDSMKNFDLSSPEVKQQFDQIGLTPEEVISKIMANPDVAMAFQNPRVQQAIMECSQNPMSITKYQNDKEVMDVFNKISELFPGVSGSPY